MSAQTVEALQKVSPAESNFMQMSLA